VIASFRSQETEQVFNGRAVPGLPPDIQRRARLKLRMLDAARSLDDLRSPPGNRLETLRGDRQGQHSIRINDQWRVRFVWDDGRAFDVEITDYH
jgi:toxin HigB-1